MEQSAPMEKKSLLKRVVLWLTGMVLLLAVLLAVLATVYEDKIKSYALGVLNSNLHAKVEVKDINLSLIRKFPYATLYFTGVTVHAPAHLKKKNAGLFGAPLLKAEALHLQFNLFNVFSDNIVVRRIEAEDGVINVVYDKKGNSNLDIFKSEKKSSDSFSMELEKIMLHQMTLRYTHAGEQIKYAFYVRKAALSGNFSEKDYALKADVQAFARNVQHEKISYLSDKEISLKAELNVTGGNRYEWKAGRLRIEDLAFALNGFADLSDSTLTRLDCRIEGEDIGVTELLSLLPARYKDRTADYEGTGVLDFKGRIWGKVGERERPDVQFTFGLQDADLRQKNSGVTLHGISLQGKFVHAGSTRGSAGTLSLTGVKARLGDGNIGGSLTVDLSDEPTLDADGNFSFSGKDVLDFVKIDTLESLEGMYSGRIRYHGPLQTEGDNIAWGSIKAAGQLTVSRGVIRIKNARFPVEEVEAVISVDDRSLRADKFSCRLGGSDFSLQGEAINAIPFFLNDEERVEINAGLQHRMLNLSELFADQENTDPNDTAYKVKLSPRVRATLQWQANALQFGKFEAKNVSASARLADEVLVLNNVEAECMGGSVSGSLQIDGRNRGRFKVVCGASMKGLDMAGMLYQLNNFGQQQITDKNLKGMMNADLSFSAVWTDELQCEVNTIRSESDITIEQGRLMNFEPMKKLSRFISVDDLMDIRFSTLSNHIVIENSVITIPEMDIASNAINVKAWGTHSFSNMVDYHFKVRLNDILFRKARERKKDMDEFAEAEEGGGKGMNLFITMTGPLDNPKITFDKLGYKRGANEKVQEEKSEVKSLLREEMGLFKKDPSAQGSSKGLEKAAAKPGGVEWEETAAPKKDNALPKVEAVKKESEKPLFKRDKEKKKKDKTENADDFN